MSTVKSVHLHEKKMLGQNSFATFLINICVIVYFYLNVLKLGHTIMPTMFLNSWKKCFGSSQSVLLEFLLL